MYDKPFFVCKLQGTTGQHSMAHWHMYTTACKLVGVCKPAGTHACKRKVQELVDGGNAIHY